MNRTSWFLLWWWFPITMQCLPDEVDGTGVYSQHLEHNVPYSMVIGLHYDFSSLCHFAGQALDYPFSYHPPSSLLHDYYLNVPMELQSAEFETSAQNIIPLLHQEVNTFLTQYNCTTNNNKLVQNLRLISNLCLTTETLSCNLWALIDQLYNFW